MKIEWIEKETITILEENISEYFNTLEMGKLEQNCEGSKWGLGMPSMQGPRIPPPVTQAGKLINVSVQS